MPLRNGGGPHAVEKTEVPRGRRIQPPDSFGLTPTSTLPGVSSLLARPAGPTPASPTIT